MTSEHKKMSTTQRYVTTVIRDLSGGLTWNARLNPGFTADEVIVRCVSYSDNPVHVNVWLLWTDMIQGDGIVSTFINPSISAPQTHLKMNIDAGNVVQFRVLSVNAASTLITPPGDATGTLVMTLEFVKY